MEPKQKFNGIDLSNLDTPPIDIDPYDNETSSKDSEEKAPAAPPKERSREKKGDVSKIHCIHITDADYRLFNLMYLGHCIVNGRDRSFAAYMRHLILQGFKAEPRDVRDRKRELEK